MTTLVLTLLVLVALLWLASYPFPKILVLPMIFLTRRMLGFKRHAMDVDGYFWYFMDSGEKPGAETIVLVHGFGADKESWFPYARFLTDKYRVIAVDLPGFGENPKNPKLDYTPDIQAERLQRFIEKLDLGRVHLVGNSMGGMVIKHLGIKFPELPLSLVFMNSAGIASQRKSQLELAVDKGENPLLVRDIRELDDLMSLVTHEPVKLPAVFRRYFFKQMQQNFDFFNTIFWTLLKDGNPPDLTPQLPQIKAPVLILWGEHDQLLDVSCAHAIKRELPNSTLVIFDDVGHAPMLEIPQRAAEEHLKFLQAL